MTGLSATDVARQIGVPRPYDSLLEGGKRRLSAEHVWKMARVKLNNNREVTAAIPGQGLGGLQPHSIVLVEKGRTKDVPGVRYRIVRGTQDCLDENTDANQRRMVRMNSRSKYGAKKVK